VTKSKMVGRGGSRPGAGRKRKPVAGPTHVASDVDSEDEPRPAAPIIPVGLSSEDLKKFCEALAFETLATIATTGTSEPARVAASRELLDRAQGKPKPGTAAKSDAPGADEGDGWGDLLSARPPSTAGRAN
jgi:hypothetical protein